MDPLNQNTATNAGLGVDFPQTSNIDNSRISDILSKFSNWQNDFQAKIGNSGQDITSVENVWRGKAKAVDYGDIVGTAIGTYFGHPEIGRFAGRNIFKTVRSLF